MEECLKQAEKAHQLLTRLAKARSHATNLVNYNKTLAEYQEKKAKSTSMDAKMAQIDIDTLVSELINPALADIAKSPDVSEVTKELQVLFDDHVSKFPELAALVMQYREREWREILKGRVCETIFNYCKNQSSNGKASIVGRK